MKTEQHSRRKDTLAGWPVNITTYRIGDTYHCHVANESPGATVSRAEAKTREEAERLAVEKARERLAATRRIPR